MMNREGARKLVDELYSEMQVEGAHPLTPSVLEAAKLQVIAYLEKHRAIAENVVETEARLYSEQRTLSGDRHYMVEGVVDLVKEDDKLVMYDLKTQPMDLVKGKAKVYQGQLNVYAMLWESCKEKPLQGLGIVALGLPAAFVDAARKNDEPAMAKALEDWESVLAIPLDNSSVKKTLEEFDKVVEAIEDGQFTPPAVAKLADREGGRQTFATRVCANCDARFGCESYLDYSGGKQGKADLTAANDEDALAAWVLENLGEQPISFVNSASLGTSEKKAQEGKIEKSKKKTANKPSWLRKMLEQEE